MQRIPPHNLDAEKSVLGAIMLDKDALFDVSSVLSKEDFYSEAHKEIYEAIFILNQRSAPVDILTVSEELNKRASLIAAGGREYIVRLTSDVPTTVNAIDYAKIVIEKADLRKLIRSAGEILEKSYSEELSNEQAIEFAEKEIFDIAGAKQMSQLIRLDKVLLQNIQTISKNALAKGGLTGVPSGLLDLDRLTNGFQPSDLIIIAARPSMGKTALALNVMRNAAKKVDAEVIFFSLEMSEEQLGQRLLSIESLVDSQKFRDGSVDENDWKQINRALEELSEVKIHFDNTPDIKLMEIKNKCRRKKMESGLDLVIIDYLQLMQGEGRTENRQQEVTALSRGLKHLAREMDCPVIVLSQLSRALENREDRRPRLSDLRESGAIEQDADIVMFLYRDEVYHKGPEFDNKGDCEVIIAKHRNGAIDTVHVGWQEKFTRFVNKDRK
ncbi:MAG: replicative DNA helicase [Anaerovoracaceae bacterium]